MKVKMTVPPDTEFRLAGPGDRKRDGDEIFTVTHFGSFNISKLQEWIRVFPDKFRFQMEPITMSLVSYIWRNNDPDRARLAEMTEASIAERYAISFLTGSVFNGRAEVQLIDGNHYILKCHELGHKQFRQVIVPNELMRHFEVWMEAKIDGRWLRVSPESMLEFTRGKYTMRADNERGYVLRTGHG